MQDEYIQSMFVPVTLDLGPSSDRDSEFNFKIFPPFLSWPSSAAQI